MRRSSSWILESFEAWIHAKLATIAAHKQRMFTVLRVTAQLMHARLILNGLSPRNPPPMRVICKFTFQMARSLRRLHLGQRPLLFPASLRPRGSSMVD